MTSARLQCYAAFLSRFDYKVVFRKGSENINADCLSQAPLTDESTPYTDGAINEEVFLSEETINAIYTPRITFDSILILLYENCTKMKLQIWNLPWITG
ncbi:hypothetical protein QE152_g7259 [Popillia japonica]|uniref:Uncharacterized protein n=1 Tax=Popillia japonica TaxID=7064 RepID=A0AAW1MC01_POPJA